MKRADETRAPEDKDAVAKKAWGSLVESVENNLAKAGALYTRDQPKGCETTFQFVRDDVKKVESLKYPYEGIFSISEGIATPFFTFTNQVDYKLGWTDAQWKLIEISKTLTASSSQEDENRIGKQATVIDDSRKRYAADPARWTVFG